MPSGFELKPTRLMPLMERSECSEVLLVEWGAPARETGIQHGSAAAPKHGARRKSCPDPGASPGWPCVRTGSAWLSSPEGCHCITLQRC